MNGSFEQTDPPFPFRVDPRFELWATGQSTDGGLVEIHFAKKLIDNLNLSVIDWVVVAQLIKAGKKSKGSHWAIAFMTAKKLAGELKRLAHRGSGAVEDVHRAIHRLRKLLDKSLATELQPATDPSRGSWAKQLIEHHPRFGYRMSLPPSQLNLTELDDETGE